MPACARPKPHARTIVKLFFHQQSPGGTQTYTLMYSVLFVLLSFVASLSSALQVAFEPPWGMMYDNGEICE